MGDELAGYRTGDDEKVMSGTSSPCSMVPRAKLPLCTSAIVRLQENVS